MSNNPDPLKSVIRLVVLVGGFLTISLMGYLAYQIFKQTIRDRTASNIIFTDPNNPSVKTTKVGLSSFEIIEGTPYRIAPVFTYQVADRGYYSKGAISPTNYLVLNAKDKSAIRLTPTNNALFTQYQKIGQNDKNGKLVKASGIWYELVKADTDGDKRLTEADRKTIAVSDLSGANYTEVIPKVDRLFNTFQVNQTNVLMVYESAGKNFVTELDLSQRKSIETKELPTINHTENLMFAGKPAFDGKKHES